MRASPPAATAIVGLIGRPVGHSVSPRFQQAAFDALGLPWRYEAWETATDQLPAQVDSLRAGPRVGANVTAPHKEAVAAFLDGVSATARITGAVNTISRAGDRLIGDNTDVAGFLDALTLDGGFEPAGSRAVLLGAGGAARAVAYGLLQAGVARVSVVNRTPERARAMVGALGDSGGRLRVAENGMDSVTAFAGCDLIVNCTTLGLAGSAGSAESYLTEAQIPAGVFVCDIVANPLETPLLHRAGLRGCRTLGGLPMLVRQGAAAFTLWTGLPAPTDVMLAAARAAMASRAAG